MYETKVNNMLLLLKNIGIYTAKVYQGRLSLQIRFGHLL